MSPGDCGVTWCEVDGWHERHEQVLGTWLGVAATGELREVTVQAVVYGQDARTPSLALVLVDSLVPTRPLNVTVDWEQGAELGWQLVDAASRWTEK